jgi:IMP dehydrogenase
MTPREKLVFVKEGAEGADRDEAKRLMNKHRLERVLVVNDAFELRGLITVKDIQKSTEHPLASKDSQGKLLVGAAVGVGQKMRSASSCWSRPALTCWWSTPPTATRKASWIA